MLNEAFSKYLMSYVNDRLAPRVIFVLCRVVVHKIHHPRRTLMKTLPAETSQSSDIQPADQKADATGTLARLGIRFTAWAERWFPDAFIFVAIAVVIVALGALANGVPAASVAQTFGDGFWSLIPFTMQMAFVTIGGYVVATSPPVQGLI